MSARNLSQLILSIFLLASCSNTTPITSKTPQATNVPPTASNTLTPTVRVTETVFYADTLTPAAIEEIAFPVDTKWVDITKHFPAESDRTFHIKATQGQILMAAVQQGALYPIAIVGDDGVSLTGRWFHPYWRGTLPATQGYSITVYNYQYTPAAVDLTIRLALSASGETGQVFAYHNEELGLSFNYPASFAPMDYPTNSSLLKDTQQLLSLALVDPTYFDNTNLSEAFLVVATNDMQSSDCEFGNEHETFNSLDFAHFTTFDAGAGSIYQYHVYQTAQARKCFQFIVWLHSSNLENYDPSVNIKAFDEAAILRLFTNILETVIIIK